MIEPTPKEQLRFLLGLLVIVIIAILFVLSLLYCK